MRIKVDENIGNSGVAMLKQGGHDVLTVREQGLAGQPTSVFSTRAQPRAARS